MKFLDYVCGYPMRAQARFREACVGGGGVEPGIMSVGPGCGGECRFSR